MLKMSIFCNEAKQIPLYLKASIRPFETNFAMRSILFPTTSFSRVVVYIHV